MSEKDAYLEIADHALLASKAALDVGIHSKGAFLGYHAFESVGGAVCCHQGRDYPRGHDAKIRVFTQAVTNRPYSTHVANLAMSYKSIGRNALMYPTLEANGQVKLPSQMISSSQAERLRGRTASLVERIRKDI